VKEIIIAGGGAAGFFTAINCAYKHPDYKITILEKSSKLLAKVKVSGGGRCNVTHVCFEPAELVKYYPRGEKQLLGPFTRFNPANTAEWFEARGVPLKRESDGRMFPESDSSQTIIDCFLSEAKRLGIHIKLQTGVEDLIQNPGKWLVRTNRGETLTADSVVITTGSSLQIWEMLGRLGHTMVPEVPSLFTFNISDSRLKGLEGLSVENAEVTIKGNSKLRSSGPLLVTHWGLSGPAILRLSAWGARILAQCHYIFDIEVNWTGQHEQEVKEMLMHFKKAHPRKNVNSNPLFNMPRRLWERLIEKIDVNFAGLSNQQIETIVKILTCSIFHVSGKSTYKDEFVTAGGVALNEVDFRTMQSKKFEGLYFAGEVLDIDALTGGFNFQAAWTTAWLIANAL
jgi:predicted Rossmann fold flavoprotein